MMKRFKHVKIWSHLAIELSSINTELKQAADRKDRYAIPGTTDNGHPARSTNQTSCPARQGDLVGIEHNANKLKQCLVEHLKEENYKIISVWGMGGAGKTTLVDHVFKIVKENFDVAAWVTVSKDNYQLEVLLTNIAREFDILDAARTMEIRNLVGVIRSYLEDKSYILVLDDIWEKDVCIKIMEVLPSNCISRVVLTPRIYEVAQLASSNCALEVEPLGKKYSWKLFCKLAFRNNDEKMCPSELQHLAAKLLHKCGGLPLAISCIGRLLSYKPSTYSEWEKVYDELQRQPTTSMIHGVDSILKVSLDDLSYELKNCFLHCALFPEDSRMNRSRLIRHWTAAGFIKEKENKIMEVAEGYLYDLVNRSLLQVVEINTAGRVKCCRMHDLLRDLALNKAEKECFGTVYEGSGTFVVDSTRRLSIQSTNTAPSSQSHAPRLRAIHAFTRYVDIDLLRPILASSILLSTLDLQGTQIKMLPNEVFNMFNLRFLGLRYTGIEILPEEVGRLQNLEVLDAFDTCLLSLPKGVAKLKKLRYVYASAWLTKATTSYLTGVTMPRGIRNLTRLYALQSVKASLESLSDVAALTELRTFAVCDVTSEHSSSLCSAIMNMNHLVHVTITASNENEVLPCEALHLPETLSKLELGRQLEKKQLPQIISSWSHLNKLTRLYLVASRLDEDSFSSLMVLRGLFHLSLTKAYDGTKLYLPSRSFCRLQKLTIMGARHLTEVEIEEGALESLAEFVFEDCPGLNRLPCGIEYLTALEKLYLQDTAEELIEKLRQERDANESSEELRKISHIKKVTVRLTEKNIWEKIR